MRTFVYLYTCISCYKCAFLAGYLLLLKLVILLALSELQYSVYFGENFAQLFYCLYMVSSYIYVNNIILHVYEV